MAWIRKQDLVKMCLRAKLGEQEELEKKTKIELLKMISDYQAKLEAEG